MRRLLGLLGIAFLAGWALAACAPAPTPPSNPVGRAIWRMTYRPQPTATPDVGNRMCLEAYRQQKDNLPVEFIYQMALLDPAEFAMNSYFPAAEAATNALSIPQSSFSTITTYLPSGNYVVAVQWCAPYGGYDVYVEESTQQLGYLVTVEGVDYVHLWSGEDSLLIWASATGPLLHKRQIWIAEKRSDGSWEVVYEKSRAITATAGFPTEVTLEQHGATLDYTLASGEHVIRRFQVTTAGYVLIDEQRIEP